jgi:hypothetical protein
MELIAHLMGDDLLNACELPTVGNLLVVPISTPEHITCEACKEIMAGLYFDIASLSAPATELRTSLA